MRHLIREYHVDPFDVCDLADLKAMLWIDNEINRKQEEDMKRKHK